MGSGGSKPSDGAGGQPPRPYHSARTEARATSGTASTNTTRPPTGARAPEPRPTVPDTRVNSASRENELQYLSPRGNLPATRVNHVVGTAPAAPATGRGRRFPKTYRNAEGPRDDPHHNFEPWEVGPGGQLTEYPVKTLVQPTPMSSNFNFARNPATLAQLRPPPPNDVDNYRRRWREPPNDPGAIRAVADTNGRVVGAMYHPEGNPAGFERARLAPLDRQGRVEAARSEDKRLTGRTTWPERGSGYVLNNR